MAAQARILKNPQEILPYLNAIKEAADANREALGFNPVGVYEDSIKKGKLWVAADAKGNYLGHIMLGGKPPQELRIFQIYVGQNERGSGIASFLINEATAYGENLSCLNMRADVANELTSAVKFWQSQGFCATAHRRKKNASGREVSIFQKRLSTPSLLPNEALPLSITAPSIANVLDSYVIDLNIFLTLLKDQENSKLISEIMQAAMAGEFSLFVTPEFQEELRRAKIGGDDPIFDLAEKALPVLDKIDDGDLQELKEEIRAIVFPNRSRSRKEAANDESDLSHLAYCVQNAKAGFITEEKALLRAKDTLCDKYGLTLYSPQDFKVEHFGNIDPSPINVPLSNEEGSVHIADVKNIGQIQPFLDKLNGGLAESSKAVLKSSARGVREKKVIAVGQDICAVYVAKTKGAKHDVLEGFFISTDGHFSNREVVFQHMLECFMRHSQTIKATNIIFYVRGEDFDLEKICMGRGFERIPTSAVQGMVALAKVPCPPLVTKANWGAFREVFAKNTGVELPRLIPAMMVNASGVPIIQAAKNGRDYEVDLFKLETLLSPSLIMLSKRAGVILPIAPAYAENLLDRSSNLLPFALSEEALLRVEKVYYRKPTHTKTFSVGMPIAFYESGSGRGVIGCARITSVKVVSCDNALKMYRGYGVLSARELAAHSDKNGNVQVITFDNFKVFSQPVSMKRLQDIGCAKANMVGPEKLSYAQLFSIVHEGMGIHARDVLISIQPDYVSKILNGKKTIELRKKPFPSNGGVRVWIYSTAPTSAIEATTFVSTVDVDTPENIWQKHKNKCGISKDDFDAYFAGATEAYALHISGAQKLGKKIKLNEIKKLSEGFTPPQYYRYVEHESDLFDALIVREKL
ncbi:MAG: GNAT family N-acetyltransferase [Alphaproteobacteria bacterium]|nr:GNAT family N-acetyltransferase [Alphaproteobacteria bacterium]MCB9984644.1 GNAT family N-acetyltransferase [Micavibrio sp.]